MTSNKDAILTAWKEAAATLATAKARESELRAQVLEVFSEEAAPGHSGTENVEVGWGYTLKIIHKLNYKLDSADDYAKVEKALDAIEKTQEGGNVIAERLVKWKGELSISEYKKLDSRQKALIDAVLTITDATPSIELVAPKGK